MSATMFETEYQAFEKVRSHLVSDHEGEFAVIVGEKLLGVFHTAVDAFEAGIRLCPDRPFLLERIGRREPRKIPHYVHGMHATSPG